MMTRLAGLLGLVCAAVWAAPEDWKREIDEIHARLQMLRAEAMELHEKGKYEEARRHAGEFIELAQHMAGAKLLPLAERLEKGGNPEAAKEVRDHASMFLHEAEKMAQHVRESGRKRSDLEEIHEGLEAGMRALKALGKNEDAERLGRVAREVEERIRHQRENRKEVDVAQHRLEVFRIAHHAFREAEKRDAAEAMGRVIQASELRLKGRRDEEAQGIYARAPKIGQQVELLMFAGKLWEEFGHETKAKYCFELGRELQEIRDREERGKGPNLERAMQRIERLEERLERIERLLRERER